MNPPRNAMQFDLSQLEAAPLQYFLLHSGVFIAVLAGTFFILGVWFGALTWGRHKKRKKALQIENTELKEEIATLKRRIAAGAVKAAPEPITSRSISIRKESTSEAPPEASTSTSEVDVPPPTPSADGDKVEGVSTAVPPSEETSADTEEVAADEALPQLPIPPVIETPAATIEPPQPPSAPTPTEEPEPPISNPTRSSGPKPSSKTAVKGDEIEPVPFLLGPIGNEVSDDVDAEATPGLLSDADQITPAEPSEPSIISPVSPAVLTSITDPPPPASWRRSSGSRTSTSVAQGLSSGGAAPMNALDDEEAAKPPRIIEPRSDPAMGALFSERPNDEDIDDLTQIAGISTLLEGQLNEFGVYTFDQIASWTTRQIEEFSERLAFQDRIVREQWVPQAQKLKG